MAQDSIACACPQCGRQFRVPANLQGRKLICKGCQAHFVVQPPKAAATAAPRAPLAPAPAGRAAATVANPPVAAATSAPAPVAPATSDLAPIPFDDAPVPLDDSHSAPPDQTISTRGKAMEKVKIESSGPYFVVKLVLTGKMIHVGIERTLNDYAAEGWYLEQILPVGSDAYAILRREQDGEKEDEPESSDVKTM